MLHLGVSVFEVLVEGKAILKTRAATARNEDAQLQVGVGFFGNQLSDFGRCGVGENQSGCASGEFSIHGHQANRQPLMLSS